MVLYICAVADLCQAFDGLPPDGLLVDLSDGGALILLRHLRRALQQVWGSGDGAATSGGGAGPAWAPPPVLALLPPQALGQPDWLAFADDILLPPYAPEEARARLRMLSFRRRHIADGDLLRVQDVTLDRSTRRASGPDGAPLSLTPREFDLLQFLVAHRGKLWSRQRLLDLVWGVNFEGGARTVDIHVRRLRAKLPPEAASRLETRRGVGYGFA
jgi:hypothetical protein